VRLSKEGVGAGAHQKGAAAVMCGRRARDANGPNSARSRLRAAIGICGASDPVIIIGKRLSSRSCTLKAGATA